MGNIRFLLALAVVFTHAWTGGASLVGGRNAVQLFYMISGFLISFVLLETRNYGRPRDFYLNRALRLYPTYYVVALISLVSFVILDERFVTLYREIPGMGAISLVVANVLIVGQDWLMFTGADASHFGFTANFSQSPIQVWQGLLVPPAWSLGVEISFYLIAPFVLKRRRLVYALAALSILLRAWIIHRGIGRQDPWSYRFFPTELLLFLAGALSHQLLLRGVRALAGRMRMAASRTATFGFIALIVVFPLIPAGGALKSAGLLCAFFFVLPFTFVYQCDTVFDRKIGELSYPLYICHYLVVEIAFHWMRVFEINDTIPAACVIAGVSVAFAYALNEVVGKNVEHLRDRFRRRPEEAALLGAPTN